MKDKLIAFESWVGREWRTRYINPDKVLYVEKCGNSSEIRIVLQGGSIEVRGDIDKIKYELERG